MSTNFIIDWPPIQPIAVSSVIHRYNLIVCNYIMNAKQKPKVQINEANQKQQLSDYTCD